MKPTIFISLVGVFALSWEILVPDTDGSLIFGIMDVDGNRVGDGEPELLEETLVWSGSSPRLIAMFSFWALYC